MTVLYDVLDPATEETVTTVAQVDADAADVAIARAAAVRASWASVSPGDRARLLRRFAETVDAHIDELAALEVRNAGHTIGNARFEAGNVRTSCTTTRARPSGSSAVRSRWQAASM